MKLSPTLPSPFVFLKHAHQCFKVRTMVSKILEELFVLQHGAAGETADNDAEMKKKFEDPHPHYVICVICAFCGPGVDKNLCAFHDPGNCARHLCGRAAGRAGESPLPL